MIYILKLLENMKIYEKNISSSHTTEKDHWKSLLCACKKCTWMVYMCICIKAYFFIMNAYLIRKRMKKNWPAKLLTFCYGKFICPKLKTFWWKIQEQFQVPLTQLQCHSLCYTLGLCCLSILGTTANSCQSQPSIPSLLQSFSPLATTSLFSMSVSLSCFIDKCVMF